MRWYESWVRGRLTPSGTLTCLRIPDVEASQNGRLKLWIIDRDRDQVNLDYLKSHWLLVG